MSGKHMFRLMIVLCMLVSIATYPITAQEQDPTETPPTATPGGISPEGEETEQPQHDANAEDTESQPKLTREESRWIVDVLGDYEPDDDYDDWHNEELRKLYEEAQELPELGERYPYTEIERPDINEQTIWLYLIGELKVDFVLDDSRNTLRGICFGVLPSELSPTQTGDTIVLYSEPNTESAVVGVFNYGDHAVVLARDESTEWVLVQANGSTAWIQSVVLDLNCDLESLPVYTAQEAVDNRQGFRFRSQPDPASQDQRHGMVIVNPNEEVASLMINDTEISLSGGGVFLSTPTDDTMTVQTLDGTVSLIDPAGEMIALDGMDDNVFTVGLEPIPLEDSEPVDRSDSGSNALIGLVLEELIGQPTVVGTIDIFRDEADDVLDLGTEEIVSNPKVDVEQVGVASLFNGDLAVNVIMGEPLSGDVYSFGLRAFVFGNHDDDTLVSQWVQHDNDREIYTGVYDFDLGAFVNDPPGTGIQLDYDLESGVIRFVFPASALPPVIVGAALESTMSPTEDSELQPAFFDDFVVELDMVVPPPVQRLPDCTVASSGTVNLRSGPGTNFDLAGTLAAGESVVATGQANGADGFVWWKLANGAWVRSDLVTITGDCELLPVVDQ